MMGRSGGSSPFLDAALSDTAVLVKTGKVGLASFDVYNPSNAVAFVRFYDAAAASDVTIGTTVPVYVVGAKTVEFASGRFTRPIQFTKGMVIGGVTTFADSSHTAPSSALNVCLGLST